MEKCSQFVKFCTGLVLQVINTFQTCFTFLVNAPLNLPAISDFLPNLLPLTRGGAWEGFSVKAQ